MDKFYYSNTFRYFGHLCEVPQDVLDNLNSYYDMVQDNVPDQNLPHYKQWYIQKPRHSRHDLDKSWFQWTDKDFLEPSKIFFHQFISKILRFRFTWLEKGQMVDYHVRHELPRIHVPLNDSGSIFVIKDENGVEHEYNLEYGHAHFINVTLHHKVFATKDVDRKNVCFCLASFKNQKITEKFLK